MNTTRNCEFAEWDDKTQGFPSTWRNERESAIKSVQTDEITFTETGIQCDESQQKSVQTDFEEIETQVNTLTQPYPPSLYAFFAKVTENMCKSLQENLDPFAFEVFKDCGDEDNVPQKKAVKEFTFKSSSVSVIKFTSSCVAWNKKGTQVALGHIARKHQAWCSHRVPVSCWNLRRIMSKKYEPHSEIFLPSCITCMEFHPFYPSVLALGLFSGSVAIVDFSNSSNSSTPKNNEEVGASGDGSRKFDGFKRADQMAKLGYFLTRPEHTLPISSIHWMKLTPHQSAQLAIKNKAASPYFLITGGKDGYICLWSSNTAGTKIFLEKKFIAWADSISGDVPLKLTTRCFLKQLGILDLSCCKDDPFTCLLVTFGGFVFQGNLDGNIEAYTAMEELEVKSSLIDPGLTYISSFKGLIKSIDCSPFHRDIFLMATTEGTVIVQNMLELKNQIFHCELESGHLSDAKWSARPAMFAVAHGKVVDIFDLTVGKKAVMTILHEHNITNISFNENEIGTLAVSDIKGTVHVWNLPKTFSSLKPQELDVLINSSESNFIRVEGDEADLTEDEE